jgi:hypothetical protein
LQPQKSIRIAFQSTRAFCNLIVEDRQIAKWEGQETRILRAIYEVFPF